MHRGRERPGPWQTTGREKGGQSPESLARGIGGWRGGPPEAEEAGLGGEGVMGGWVKGGGHHGARTTSHRCRMGPKGCRSGQCSRARFRKRKSLREKACNWASGPLRLPPGHSGATKREIYFSLKV